MPKLHHQKTIALYDGAKKNTSEYYVEKRREARIAMASEQALINMAEYDRWDKAMRSVINL